MEIAAFDAFASLLSEADITSGFAHVVFDTAPTGHTLRLLRLPTAWTAFLESHSADRFYTGPRLGLPSHQARYAGAVAALADAQRTTVVLVTRPEPSALLEAARTSTALVALGLRHQCLVVNAVFHATRRDDPVAIAWERRGQQALAAMPETLRALPQTTVPLHGQNIIGIAALRALFTPPARAELRGDSSVPLAPLPALPSLVALIDVLATARQGLVIVTGKGGVGKTTIAAAIAAALAGRGLPAHLTTTDPAAHVAATLAITVPGLTVSRIDPAVETQVYRQHALEHVAPTVDVQEFAFLEEDLHSPCTEEVAVFRAFARLVSSGAERDRGDGYRPDGAYTVAP